MSAQDAHSDQGVGNLDGAGNQSPEGKGPGMPSLCNQSPEGKGPGLPSLCLPLRTAGSLTPLSSLRTSV